MWGKAIGHGKNATDGTPPLGSVPLASRQITGLAPLTLDELALTERLIGYDTSSPEGIKKAAGFVKGWLESRDIAVAEDDVRGLPVLVASIGAESGPTVALHGHLDVVPAHPEQFTPTIDGERLYGRGAYDMKGGLAAMMGAVQELREQQDVKVLFMVVPDEESEEERERGTDYLLKSGYKADFAITGEPTDLHIGIQAKGVLAMRLEVAGTAAHGATPWLGDNAVLKAIDTFRTIESLPFTRESSDLFDRPSTNLGRILGGDALNKVPDSCVIDIDIRYLPEQDPAAIRAQVEAPPRRQAGRSFRACAGDRRPQRPVRADPDGGGLAAARHGGDQRRSRRRLGGRLVHTRRDTGGRVRPRRSRPPRSGGVGRYCVADELQAGSDRLRDPDTAAIVG